MNNDDIFNLDTIKTKDGSYSFQQSLLERLNIISTMYLNKLVPSKELTEKLNVIINKWKMFYVENYFSNMYDTLFTSSMDADTRIRNTNIMAGGINNIHNNEDAELLTIQNKDKVTMKFFKMLMDLQYLSLLSTEQAYLIPTTYNKDWSIAENIKNLCSTYVKSQVEFKYEWLKFQLELFVMIINQPTYPYKLLFSGSALYFYIEFFSNWKKFFNVTYTTLIEESPNTISNSKIIKNAILNICNDLNDNSGEITNMIEMIIFTICVFPGTREHYVYTRGFLEDKDFRIKQLRLILNHNKRNPLAMSENQHDFWKTIYENGELLEQNLGALLNLRKEIYQTLMLILLHFYVQQQFQFMNFFYRFVIPMEGIGRYLKEIREYEDYPVFLNVEPFTFVLYYRGVIYEVNDNDSFYLLIDKWLQLTIDISAIKTLFFVPWIGIWKKNLPTILYFEDVYKDPHIIVNYREIITMEKNKNITVENNTNNKLTEIEALKVRKQLILNSLKK